MSVALLDEPVTRPDPVMLTVVVTGAIGPLHERVVQGLAAIDGVHVIVATNGRDIDDGPVDTADVVVDLASSDHDGLAERRESATQYTSFSLGLADELVADHVVFVSSALVYGANDNNAFPITEETVLRPDNEFVFARQLASAEELVEQWRRSRPGRASCVLRPAIALASDGTSRLASAIVAGLGRRVSEDDPPAQFLHLEDLASAIVLGVVQRLDGVFNVSPDGWVAGDRVRALSGERPRVPLPERVSEVLSGLRWRFQRGPIPPGLRSYTQTPWVVSNGRLRERGWTPRVTNEQAYVEATEAPWWTMVSPKRRQELSLGVGVTGLLIGVFLAVTAGRRLVSRRS